MRLRFNELLREHGLTPYKFARRSKGRVSASTAYRLARENGQVDMVSLDVLEALMDICGHQCQLFTSSRPNTPPPDVRTGLGLAAPPPHEV
jgi:hypothetical protein